MSCEETDDESDTFWSDGGRLLAPDSLSVQELSWLRRINDTHGHDPGCASKGSGFLGDSDRAKLRGICGRLVRQIARHHRCHHFFDLAVLSSTSRCGHPPHVDNERPVRQADGSVVWLSGVTAHRSWSASVAVSEPSEYDGGEFVFYDTNSEPQMLLKEDAGTMIAFLGDHRHPHGVLPVTSGERLVLTLFLRADPVRPAVPRLHRRRGTGKAVYLEPSINSVSVGVCFVGWASLSRNRAKRDPPFRRTN